jgi:hypothetical protein
MRRHRRSTRVRRRIGPGEYDVRARVERFGEPAVLLLLRERPAHGYDLLEQLPKLTGERVDMGNLYRFLRLLEAEGLVRSEWDDAAPGPSKRIYELTDEGRPPEQALGEASPGSRASASTSSERSRAEKGVTMHHRR